MIYVRNKKDIIPFEINNRSDKYNAKKSNKCKQENGNICATVHVT
jgi:hypothetical protein